MDRITFQNQPSFERVTKWAVLLVVSLLFTTTSCQKNSEYDVGDPEEVSSFFSYSGKEPFVGKVIRTLYERNQTKSFSPDDFISNYGVAYWEDAFVTRDTTGYYGTAVPVVQLNQLSGVLFVVEDSLGQLHQWYVSKSKLVARSELDKHLTYQFSYFMGLDDAIPGLVFRRPNQTKGDVYWYCWHSGYLEKGVFYETSVECYVIPGVGSGAPLDGGGGDGGYTYPYPYDPEPEGGGGGGGTPRDSIPKADTVFNKTDTILKTGSGILDCTIKDLLHMLAPNMTAHFRMLIAQNRISFKSADLLGYAFLCKPKMVNGKFKYEYLYDVTAFEKCSQMGWDVAVLHEMYHLYLLEMGDVEGGKTNNNHHQKMVTGSDYMAWLERAFPERSADFYDMLKYAGTPGTETFDDDLSPDERGRLGDFFMENGIPYVPSDSGGSSGGNGGHDPEGGGGGR